TMKLEDNEWWFRRAFRASAPKAHRARLVFEGLDTLGEIWLNGQTPGRAENMLIAHRFDVTDTLREGENELIVRITSSARAGYARRKLPGEHTGRYNHATLALRKAAHMFGWDIMPRLVSAGLWRGVRLEFVPPVHVAETYWRTLDVDATKRTARVAVDWRVESDNSITNKSTVRIRITRDGQAKHETTVPCKGLDGSLEIDLKDVDLWFPRGMGNAVLYDATVELLDGKGNVVAAKTERVGIRTIELRRTEITSMDSPGEFVFVVNGHKVFVKGTNWVPLDALHSRDVLHLKRTIDMAVDLNCNMIRCWGGNVYEDDAFYDLCDEHGIMVWQDFAMACALYPQTDEFAEQLRVEAEFIVRKFRNRACLALWAGDNECDIAHAWAKSKTRTPADNRATREVLPEVLTRIDPHRPYLPSSPYLSEALWNLPVEQRHTHMPEDHLWGPRDDYKGRFYTTSAAHFVSETGYHGCPRVESLREMFDPEFLWPWRDNDQWLTRATRPTPDSTEFNYRIGLMANQIAYLFQDIPENIEDFSLASQISQAEANKFFIERYRMGKWRRTGILWWNLRDGWPIISDAIVDYYYRKKLAYEYIQRLQTNVCVMCGEAEDAGHPIVVANDTLQAVSGNVIVRDADAKQVLFQADFDAPANENLTLGYLSPTRTPAMWRIEYTHDGKTFHNHYLAGPRPYRLADYKRWLNALR
ncbi:MAG: glycoside hydrolase family 2, partial [Phycisphaerae bacterium]|nr:glycoside hydrolase family 2 [Phycisphaerae bacterium]